MYTHAHTHTHTKYQYREYTAREEISITSFSIIREPPPHPTRGGKWQPNHTASYWSLWESLHYLTVALTAPPSPPALPHSSVRSVLNANSPTGSHYQHITDPCVESLHCLLNSSSNSSTPQHCHTQVYAVCSMLTLTGSHYQHITDPCGKVCTTLQ